MSEGKTDVHGGAAPHVRDCLFGIEGSMGGGDHVVKAEQRVVVRRRLSCQDVQRCTRDPMLSQCLLQSLLVDQCTPRSIDQVGIRLHQSQSRFVDQVVSDRRGRCVK
jgi:hypothetical protein